MPAEALDGGFEQDDGGGSVYVVVSIYKDGLACGDGLLDARDGGGHAEHGVRIVQVVEAGMEELLGIG